ncbi:MAG: prenyltransferase/squalene oxidase repeat-containing protein [Planctomycetota bacterium]
MKSIQHSKTARWISTAALSAAFALVTISGCGKKETVEPMPMQKPAQPSGTESAKPTMPAVNPAASKAMTTATRGIEFMKAAQNPDGSWGRDFQTQDPKGNIGITSFALYGIASAPGGHALMSADWFQKGFKWMIERQREDGAFADPGEESFLNYQTSIAVQTLVEVDKDKYKPQIDKAVTFILNQQFKTPDNPVMDGGIGYGSADKKRPDMSNSQMALDALKAAGYNMNSPEMKNLLKFVQRCQDDSEVNDMEWAQVGANTGGGIYRPEESKAGEFIGRGGKKSWKTYGGMTYAVFKSYIHLDLAPDSPELRSVLKWVRSEYTVSDNPGMSGEGYFYYIHTMAKSLRAWSVKTGDKTIIDGNGIAHDWASEIVDELTKRQGADGSWLNESSRWMESDPVLCSSYALSALGAAAE